MLATTGTWPGTSNRTKVLLAGTDLYVVDLAAGTITRLDPATAHAIGRRWSAAAPLADAAVDTTGAIWALDAGGTLHQLRWATSRLSDVDKPRG